MKPTYEQIAAGQAVYTKPILSLYDVFVLGFSNRFIWKCPTAKIEALYNDNVSANHLDVGVGTGYFPDRCRFPSPAPRVALMDLNPNTLEFASRRIARYHPETYRQNVLEPITKGIPKFDSLGVNYLLHCVPGRIADKAILFDHLKPLMNPGAAVFGSTLVQEGVAQNGAAKLLLEFYNSKKIMSNREDNLDDLEAALNQRFDDVTLQVSGCVALFSAKVG